MEGFRAYLRQRELLAQQLQQLEEREKVQQSEQTLQSGLMQTFSTFSIQSLQTLMFSKNGPESVNITTYLILFYLLFALT